jgi:hypothetical protein
LEVNPRNLLRNGHLHIMISAPVSRNVITVMALKRRVLQSLL